jgi:ribonuclease-3
MASSPSARNAFQIVLDFEQRLAFSFNDKTLLLRALTHRSYLNESALLFADNERLEFLGDAVLDLLVAELLYQRFPELHEGFLTAMRSSLVRREALAQFGRQIELGNHLLMGRGEEESGGRERDAILCATFEAIIGAIYLDQGLVAAARFLHPLIEPELQALRSGQMSKDAKSLLQEWSQATLNATPAYVTVETSGPDHAREFTVAVRIGGVTYGLGRGASKQRAAQEAAGAALFALQDHKLAPPPPEAELPPPPEPTLP